MNFKDFSFWRYLRSVPSLWCFRNTRISNGFCMFFYDRIRGREVEVSRGPFGRVPERFSGRRKFEKIRRRPRCPEVRLQKSYTDLWTPKVFFLRRRDDVRGVQRSVWNFFRTDLWTPKVPRCHDEFEVSRGPCGRDPARTWGRRMFQDDTTGSELAFGKRWIFFCS